MGLSTLVGARLDALHLTPETGLLVLTFWTPDGARRLALGLGPRVVGVAWAREAPGYAASVRHPLLAAGRAHLAGRHVRSAESLDDGTVRISLGDKEIEGTLTARPGGCDVVAGERVSVRWTAAGAKGHRALHLDSFPGEVGEVASGDEGVRVSDGVAAELRRASLAKALRAQSKRLARRSEAVQQDLARLDDTERLRRTGRMLLAQGAKVPRGATTAVLEDWEAGGTLEVTLDPSVPAKQQAERFFHEARRVQRGAEQMWARYEATERELEAVRALLAEVDAALELSPITLRAWGEAARALKVVVHDGVDARGRVRTTVPERLPFHAYRTEDGHKVLVGRGAADNDRLTVSVARPQDLWLHARGYPGAHVVVPLQRGEAPPPGALLDAATLAAHHSDARGQDLVEVTWTERRYVRKARKSAVGQVTVDRERVLALRLEPARLARLLASRDDG
jgi:hypothetical protein